MKLLNIHDATHPNYRTILALVLMLVTIGQFSIDVYLPGLPAIARYFDTSPELAQMSLTVYLFMLGSMTIVFGILGDAYGRRIIILIGVAVFTLGSIMAIFATSIELFLFARAIQGCGIAAEAALCMAILRDTFHTKRSLAEATVYVSITWSLVPIIAPVIGGYVVHYSFWQNCFILIALYGLCSLSLLWRYLPETASEKQIIRMKPILLSYRQIVSQPVFMAYIFICTLTFGQLIVFNVIGPFLYQEKMDYNAAQYGLFLLFIMTVQIGGCLLNGRLIHRFEQQAIILTSGLVGLLGCFLYLVLALVFGLNVYSVTVPMVLIALGNGPMYVNSLSLAMASIDKNIGKASALNGFIQLNGIGLISFIVAKLNHMSLFAFGLIQFALGLLCLLCCCIAFRARKRAISIG